MREKQITKIFYKQLTIRIEPDSFSPFSINLFKIQLKVRSLEYAKNNVFSSSKHWPKPKKNSEIFRKVRVILLFWL